MKSMQSLFISHASSDKQDYILPLASALTSRKVTFWLDSLEMSWGDSIALKINEGLHLSRYVLLCLSKNFLARPWPESEMNAALTMQNKKGIKKVLPLILNSKALILQNYPLISGVAYREFGIGVDNIADELAILTGSSESSEGKLQVIIESIHTGQTSNLLVSPRASIEWLAERARIGAGLKDAVHLKDPENSEFRGLALLGNSYDLRIKWILVDSQAEDTWNTFPEEEKRKIRALVKSKSGIKISYDEGQKLADIDIYDGIIFHLYASEDYHFRMVFYSR